MKKLIIFFWFISSAYGQFCSSLNPTFEYEFVDTCSEQNMTMQHDNTNRPFLYVAAKAGGLKIYNLTDQSLIETVSVADFNYFDVMNVHQDGDYLYLSLGDHFNVFSEGGMAIVNISDPFNAVIEDVWDSTFLGGAGIVKTEGDYAYLGCMFNGLVILDIADKNNIQFKSRIDPNDQYPNFVAWPGTLKYNVRGLEVRNDIAYVTYDAGGLRIINCENKLAPVETGRYCNPLYINKPRAYNAIALNDTLAYVTVDYCGLEIINIKDTSNLNLVGWWNPWSCPYTDSADWWGSPGHTNEIAFDPQCNVVFVSSGKSDMHVVDVSNPTSPDSCNYFGGVSNGIGTWGISRHLDTLFLSYVCTDVPFTSTFSGVKVITYTPCGIGIEPPYSIETNFFPNPANEFIYIKSSQENFSVEVIDISGKIVFRSANQYYVDIGPLSIGAYILRITCGENTINEKLIKQ